MAAFGSSGVSGKPAAGLRMQPRQSVRIRWAAGLLAFVYAYFEFIAALHHTDGFVPTGRALTFCLPFCHHTHPEMSADPGGPQCGVCEFLTNLTSPALPAYAGERPSYASIPRVAEDESPAFLQPSKLHAPRGPPC